VGRRVHPEKRSVSWVNSVLRQFLPHGPTAVDAPRIGGMPGNLYLVCGMPCATESVMVDPEQEGKRRKGAQE